MKICSLFLIFLYPLSMLSACLVHDAVQTRKAMLIAGDIDPLMRSMTLEEKVGQLFFSFFYGEDLDEKSIETITNTHLGNIMYYSWANGLKCPQQVERLSNHIQSVMDNHVGLPAFVAADQEGGYVFRLGGRFTQFPGNMALGAIGDHLLSRKVGLSMAQELKAVGVNLNFAPVVDVNCNPNNPVIGVRSFGDDTQEVVRLARAMIEGMHEGGIFVTLKHFPGHGDTDMDSHLGLPVLLRTKAELSQKELIPFQKLYAETDLLMTAHILLPHIDPNRPVSLSRFFLTDLLRQEMGYQGIVISDSLVMQGVVPHQSSFEEAYQGISEAAIEAFQAGSDCLILGRLEWASFPDALSPEMNRRITERVLTSFTQAIREGRLTETRVDESLRRILLLKRKMLLQGQRFTPLSEQQLDEHRTLSELVAQKALTLLSPECLFKRIATQLSKRKILVIAPCPLQETLEKATLDFPSLSCLYRTKEEFAQDAITKSKKLLERIQESDMALFLSWNGHLWKEQKIVLDDLSSALPEDKLIVAGLRNPQDVWKQEIFNKHLVYLTYSATLPSLKAFLQSLERHRKPEGRLPMKLPSESGPQQLSN